MDHASACTLNELTNEFYARNADSFSSTRTRPWDGWMKCADVLRAANAWNGISTVLDIGCGNLRFETFLEQKLAAYPEVWAVDNCDLLLPENARVHFRKSDIVRELLENGTLVSSFDAPPCDLVCAFGIMHHIPGAANRMALLDSMLGLTRPKGYVILSFWQFMKDERIARKAVNTTRVALESYPEILLEQDDYLLGWQDRTDAFRFCHNFDSAQIDELVQHVQTKAELIARFEADGKPGNLNAYLILKK